MDDALLVGGSDYATRLLVADEASPDFCEVVMRWGLEA